MYKNMKKIITLATFLGITFFFSPRVLASPSNEVINFKTSIINNKQEALTDGSYNFRFIIFSSKTGGTPLWAETVLGVGSRLGGISVNLGENVSMPSSIFETNSELYLQVCFDANTTAGDGTATCGGGFEEEFKPRRKITAEAFALRARNLGPATISTGETAYSVNSYGGDGNILGLNFNGASRLNVSTNGNLSVLNGANTFALSPLNQRIDLTADTDIFFSNTKSVQSSSNGIDFFTAGVSRLNVNENGNIGIGTQTPLELLSVAGGNVVVSTNSGTGGRLALWDATPSQNSILKIDNSTNNQTSGDLYPVFVNATNNSTGLTQGIRSVVNTGSSNTPGELRGVAGRIEYTSTGESTSSAAGIHGFSTFYSGSVLATTGGTAYGSFGGSFVSDNRSLTQKGQVAAIYGRSDNTGNTEEGVRGLYLWTRHLEGTATSGGLGSALGGINYRVDQYASANSDGMVVGLLGSINLGGDITGEAYGTKIAMSDVYGLGIRPTNLYGASYSIGFDATTFNYGLKLDLAGGTTPATAKNYGIHVSTVTGGDESYGLYLAGASGATTQNATVWVNSGLTRLAPSTASNSSVRVAAGTDPSSPVSGDLWWNGTQLYFYNGSSNVNLLAGGGGTPAGANGEIQFNNSGSFGASSDLFWDNTNNWLGVGTNGGNKTLVVDTDGSPCCDRGLSIRGSLGDGLGLFFENSYSGANQWYFQSTDDSSAAGPGKLILRDPGTGDELFAFARSGLGNAMLGIGTNTPSEALHVTGNIIAETGRLSLLDGTTNAERILNIYGLANVPTSGNFYPIYNDNTIDSSATLGTAASIYNLSANWGIITDYYGIRNYMNNISGVTSMFGVYNEVLNNWTIGNGYGIYTTVTPGTASGNFVGNYLAVGDSTISGDLIGSQINFAGATLSVANGVYGVKIDELSGGTVSNFGVYLGEIVGTGSSSSYGLYIEGASGGSGTNASIWVDAGLTRLGASTTALSSLRIPSGFDPSAPVSGDLWWNGSELYFYDGSTNVDLLAAGGGGTPAGNDSEIQFNSSGSFGASANFYWDTGDSALNVLNGSIAASNSRVAIFDAGVYADSILEINSSTNTPLAGNYFPVRNSLTVPVAASLGFVETLSNSSTNNGSVSTFAGITNYVTNNDGVSTMYGIYNQFTNNGSGTHGFGIYNSLSPGTLTGNFVGQQLLMGAGAASGFVIGNYVSFAGGLTAGDMMAGVYVDPFSGGTNTNYGVYVGGLSGAATNSYGMYIGSVTGATSSSVGLYLAGAGTTELQIVRTGTNGIYFSNGGAEGANDIVTEDGTLNIAGAVTMTGACGDSDGGDGGVDGCDIAETFSSAESLYRGEIVKLSGENINGDWKQISRTSSKSDRAIGIISTNPTIVMGNTPFKNSRSYPVGLSGVLPTKVTDQNGLIKRGDFVTVSDMPGHGMKAFAGDLTLGVAMEDQTESTDIINVLVSRNNLPTEKTDLNPIEAKINLLQEEINLLKSQLAAIVIPGNEFTEEQKAKILGLSDLINISESVLIINGSLNVAELKATSAYIEKLALTEKSSGEIAGAAGLDKIEVIIEEFDTTSKVFVTFNSLVPQYWIEKTEGKFTVNFVEPLASDIIGDYIVIQ